MPSEKRKARKQQYFQTAKKSRKFEQGLVLREGMMGFLITCNNREKEAVREGYNLLNEFADKLVGPEELPDKVKSDSDEVDDIDAALEKEKKGLAAVKAKGFAARRFQSVDSGANNCIFIKTTLSNPCEIVENLIEEIVRTGSQRSRFILRLIPILGTCKAYDKNIEELAENIFSEVLMDDSDLSYSILFKARNSNQVSREDVYNLVGGVVRRLPGKTRVDLHSPDLCIVVEVIRSVCCIGLVRNYFGRRKYNLVELVKSTDDKQDDVVAATGDEKSEIVLKEKPDDKPAPVLTSQESAVTAAEIVACDDNETVTSDG